MEMDFFLQQYFYIGNRVSGNGLLHDGTKTLPLPNLDLSLYWNEGKFPEDAQNFDYENMLQNHTFKINFHIISKGQWVNR